MPASASMRGDITVRLAALRRLRSLLSRGPAPQPSSTQHPVEVEREVRDRLYGAGRREVLEVRRRPASR